MSGHYQSTTSAPNPGRPPAASATTAGLGRPRRLPLLPPAAVGPAAAAAGGRRSVPGLSLPCYSHHGGEGRASPTYY